MKTKNLKTKKCILACQNYDYVCFLCENNLKDGLDPVNKTNIYNLMDLFTEALVTKEPKLFKISNCTGFFGQDFRHNIDWAYNVMKKTPQHEYIIYVPYSLKDVNLPRNFCEGKLPNVLIAIAPY